MRKDRPDRERRPWGWPPDPAVIRLIEELLESPDYQLDQVEQELRRADGKKLIRSAFHGFTLARTYQRTT